MNVVVTGATGFVGRPLCAFLAARGHHVRAFVRGDSVPIGGRIETMYLRDLHDDAALCRGCTGADAVVHLAGRAHVLREEAADADASFRLVNVSGTRHVLAAAEQSGVRHFVLISSVKAIGDTSLLAWTEEQAPAPTDAYGRSKLEAEEVAREFARHTSMRVSVLRLPLVYGPGVTANVERLMALVQRGWPLPFGAIHNQRSMIFVENAIAAIVALLEANSTTEGTFFASDGADLSTPQLIRLIARALGRPARLVSIPVGVLRALGWVGDRLRRWMPMPVSSAAVERLTGSLAVETRKLSATTGWRPLISAEEGWRLTAEWYRATQGKA